MTAWVQGRCDASMALSRERCAALRSAWTSSSVRMSARVGFSCLPFIRPFRTDGCGVFVTRGTPPP